MLHKCNVLQINMLSSRYNLNRVKVTSPLKFPVLFLQNVIASVL